MNTLVSIIIPVLNEESLLEQQSAHLVQLRCLAELRIVDGGSIDASVALARSITPHVVSTEAGRAQQMNAGAEGAKADYLLFLHADTALPQDFASFVATLNTLRPDWGFFPVRLVPENRALSVVARFMNWRSRLTSVATGDQAIFVRRELFESVNGYAAIPLMEDIELSKRLRRNGRPFIWRSSVDTSSRRWRQRGILGTVVLMWELRLLYFLGVSPRRLYRRYYGN